MMLTEASAFDSSRGYLLEPPINYIVVYSVYILYSSKIDSFYKGHTSNLSNRIRQHNNGTEKSTKAGVKWTLLWSTEKESKSEAIKLELKLKNLSRQRTVAFMHKYDQEIAGHDEALLLQGLS